MKITSKKCFLFVVILSFFSTICTAQNILEGSVFDKTSKKPLPYAAILLGDTGLYTTSNEDGKFQIFLNKNVDSLEIRYLGYETKKVSANYFRLNKILYLNQFSTILSEVVVSTKRKNSTKISSRNQGKIVDNLKEKSSYSLLHELIKKYRKNKEVVESKAYFTLNSTAYVPSISTIDTIPLEQIEGFYNSKQQLSKGIINLELKTGRFGQNRLFPFYSLNHISLLKGFNLFKITNQMLPQYVGNMSLNRIKKKYHLNIQKIEGYNGTIIQFRPKSEKDELFSGKVFFQEKDLIIEKVELFIKNPKSFKLSPIVKGDSVSLKNLKLNISFNPIDLNKIQYYDLDFDFVYYTDTDKKNISSKVILFLYDYDDRFIKPYFTNTIEFKNDYDRLLTLPVSDKIWKQNYPYPKSKKNTETTNFFKKNEQFYNYFENKIPSYSLTHINISSIKWSSQQKLLNENINSGPGINLNFSYVLNPFKNDDGSIYFTVKTLFDAKRSFFKSERTYRDLDCINLAFDIFELNRHYLLGKIKKSTTNQEAQDLCNTAFLDAKITSALMFKESSFGQDHEIFNFWKNKIHNELKKYNNF